VSAASTPPVESLTGWRYPRPRPSLPESFHSVRVPRGGRFANSPALGTVAWIVVAAIVGLNGWLLLGTFREWMG
jgi:hypothetical protein